MHAMVTSAVESMRSQGMSDAEIVDRLTVLRLTAGFPRDAAEIAGLVPPTNGAASKWNPATHPYRVVRTYASAAAGLYGWSSQCDVYQTESGARAAFDALKKVRGTLGVEMSLYNPTGPRQQDWTWQPLAKWSAPRKAKR
jgi:hypothetical protein